MGVWALMQLFHHLGVVTLEEWRLLDPLVCRWTRQETLIVESNLLSGEAPSQVASGAVLVRSLTCLLETG